jgi:hypothetical protein
VINYVVKLCSKASEVEKSRLQGPRDISFSFANPHSNRFIEFQEST